MKTARITRTQPFKWLWQGRVLLGYLNLQLGEEGIGKGNLAAWIMARVTKGDLPGDLYGTSRSVVVIGDEDSFDHIWTPRLRVAGAALKRVKHVVAGTSGETFDIRTDATALEELINDDEVALVYFDQLLDNLGVDVDSWKDKHVREAIAPLRAVAQGTGVALLASLHPNKRNGSYRDRISGSPAFNALSRSSLLIARHPHVPTRRILVRPKGNYGDEPLAFEFDIEGRALRLDKGGPNERTIETSRIADWRETPISHHEVLESAGQGTSRASDARKRLWEMFTPGEERPAAEVQAEMEAAGFDQRMVREARSKIGIEARRKGYPARGYWRLPRSAQSGAYESGRRSGKD